jgi:hypothetical protein
MLFHEILWELMKVGWQSIRNNTHTNLDDDKLAMSDVAVDQKKDSCKCEWLRPDFVYLGKNYKLTKRPEFVNLYFIGKSKH